MDCECFVCVGIESFDDCFNVQFVKVLKLEIFVNFSIKNINNGKYFFKNFIFYGK